jgi:hypothetical protein
MSVGPECSKLRLRHQQYNNDSENKGNELIQTQNPNKIIYNSQQA